MKICRPPKKKEMYRPTPMFTNNMRTACKLEATTIYFLMGMFSIVKAHKQKTERANGPNRVVSFTERQRKSLPKDDPKADGCLPCEWVN